MSVDRLTYRIEADGRETLIPMNELKEGDRFKIRATDPEDCLFGKGEHVYTARSDGWLEKGVPTVTIDTADTVEQT